MKTQTINKMKNLFVTGISASIIVMNVKAQMQPANGDFENWEGIYLAENPTGWSSFNNFTVAPYNFPEMSFKTTDAHSGTYALKIISDTATLAPPFGSGTLDTIAGFVFLGPLNMDNPGVPYTLRPLSFIAFIKSNIPSGGEAYLIATLSKWNTNSQSRDEVGTAMYMVNSTITNYSKVTIPFNYNNSDIPDTLDIKIMGGNVGPGGIIIPGNTLYVDDISFTHSTVGIGDIALNTGFKVYPNPTQSKLNISSQSNNEFTFIKVFNVLGEELISAAINENSASTDVSSLYIGLYMYQISDINGNILSTGKFTKD